MLRAQKTINFRELATVDVARLSPTLIPVECSTRCCLTFDRQTTLSRNWHYEKPKENYEIQ